MYEEGKTNDFLSDAGFDAPAPDPMDAVMAIAAPKEESRHETLREPQTGGNEITVETRVRTDGGQSDARIGEAHGEYGDFAWPDGFAADPETLGKFIPLAKKLGLSKESAQSLATLYAELEQGKNKTQAEFIEKNNAEWVREIQSHPEFGGSNLQRTGENVAGMIRRFGSPLLTAQIRQMNIQNWPEMFYFLARVSQVMSEDSSPASGDGYGERKSTAQILFPDLK